MTTTQVLTRRVRTPDGVVRGKVTRYERTTRVLSYTVYVPHLTDDPPALDDPNTVWCHSWTEARETILGIYR